MASEFIEHRPAAVSGQVIMNAANADATIAFGTALDTPEERVARRVAKHYLALPVLPEARGLALSEAETGLARKLFRFLQQHHVDTLNVTGNTLEIMQGSAVTQVMLNLYVYKLLEQTQRFHPVHRIITGIQPGAEIAGAVAGTALGIDVQLYAPGRTGRGNSGAAERAMAQITLYANGIRDILHTHTHA